jgi:hypothetical protein
MAGPGPWRRALDVRADTPRTERIDRTAREWQEARRVLGDVAAALTRDAADAELIGGRSGPALRAAYEATAERIEQRAERIDKGANALARVHAAVLTARAERDIDERRAQELVEALDAAFHEAARVMAEIHGKTPTDEPGPIATSTDAEPTGTPPGAPVPRPTPDTVPAPIPDADPTIVASRPTDVDAAPGDPGRPWPGSDRPEVIAAAPSVLGAPTPVAAQTPVGLTDAVSVAGLSAGALVGVGGPAGLRLGGIAAQPRVRPIGADPRTGLGGALAPGSPVTRAGRRTPSTAAQGTARRAVRKRAIKRIRLHTRRIGRRRIEEEAMGDHA